MVPGSIPRVCRAAATSAALRDRANSSSGAPRYTTFVRSAGINRARVVNSPVDAETAIARSVCGARILSTIFWNHGVSVWFACSCKIAGMPMRHAQRRPNVVAP